MLPTELTYLAQERCKELRGEIREPSMPFFQFNFGKMLANLFGASGTKPVVQPKSQSALNRKTTVKQ